MSSRRLLSTSALAWARGLRQLEDALFLGEKANLVVAEDDDCAELPPGSSSKSPPVENEVRPQPGGISKYKPREFLHSYTLAPFVNESKVLRYLVDMGVDLSTMETKGNVADFLLKLDWKRDVQPLLQFLNRNGVPMDQLAAYVTKNPWIFQQTLDQLDTRIAYLRSKSFQPDAIARIISKARYWLNFDVKLVDSRLGWYQRLFSLTGDQIRQIVTEHPKLITFGTGYTQVLTLAFGDMGFTKEQIKQLLLADPKLFTTYKAVLTKTFDYLHNHVGFSHETLLRWARCLREPKHKIKARHEWLMKLKRAQYDPCRPNYVSLEALCRGSDEDFCKQVAKCPVCAYDEFLKLQ